MELKLLVHVPDSLRAKIGLTMAQNFLKTQKGEEKLEVRVLFNAQGVTILLEGDPRLNALMEDLVKQGGEVYFCENALRNFQIEKETLPPYSKTVPAGIRALVEWQEEGFRYVRA